MGIYALGPSQRKASGWIRSGTLDTEPKPGFTGFSAFCFGDPFQNLMIELYPYSQNSVCLTCQRKNYFDIVNKYIFSRSHWHLAQTSCEFLFYWYVISIGEVMKYALDSGSRWWKNIFLKLHKIRNNILVNSLFYRVHPFEMDKTFLPIWTDLWYNFPWHAGWMGCQHGCSKNIAAGRSKALLFLLLLHEYVYDAFEVEASDFYWKPLNGYPRFHAQWIGFVIISILIINAYHCLKETPADFFCLKDIYYEAINHRIGNSWMYYTWVYLKDKELSQQLDSRFFSATVICQPGFCLVSIMRWTSDLTNEKFRIRSARTGFQSCSSQYMPKRIRIGHLECRTHRLFMTYST